MANEAESVACPACGTQSLHAAGRFEVCPVCGWEDDPGQARDPAWAGGVNGISLQQARWDVAHFGTAFPPSEAGGS